VISGRIFNGSQTESLGRVSDRLLLLLLRAIPSRVLLVRRN
jgi:hypothetical protein